MSLEDFGLKLLYPSGTEAMTVEQLIELLHTCDPKQKVVMSDVRFGDFDVTGPVVNFLSEDNFVSDRRPILRLRKRT